MRINPAAGSVNTHVTHGNSRPHPFPSRRTSPTRCFSPDFPLYPVDELTCSMCLSGDGLACPFGGPECGRPRPGHTGDTPRPRRVAPADPGRGVPARTARVVGRRGPPVGVPGCRRAAPGRRVVTAFPWGTLFRRGRTARCSPVLASPTYRLRRIPNARTPCEGVPSTPARTWWRSFQAGPRIRAPPCPRLRAPRADGSRRNGAHPSLRLRPQAQARLRPSLSSSRGPRRMLALRHPVRVLRAAILGDARPKAAPDRGHGGQRASAPRR
jgi:hypothetical protein